MNRFHEKERELMNLEKKINPLLDDNDLVSLSYIFSEIMEKTVKVMQVRFFSKLFSNFTFLAL